MRLRYLLAVAAVISLQSAAWASNKLDGRWSLAITIPDSPGSRNQITFQVVLDALPRGDSLHGRAMITDAENKTVAAVWRQVGKRVFIIYELPCQENCATILLTGKMKGGGTLIRKGKVIVMWDKPNDRDPALYDTSVGSFSGLRLE
jgi:hypothetical protein